MSLDAPPHDDTAPQTLRFPKWNIAASDFALIFALLFALIVALAGVFGRAAQFLYEGESTLLVPLVEGLGVQVALLAAFFAFKLLPREKLRPAPERSKFGTSVLIGLKWLAFTLPAFFVAQILWVGILALCGIEMKEQAAVEMARAAQQPIDYFFIALLATVAAPLCEECLFRGALFRYLHGRLPEWWPAVLSGILFSAFHFNLLSFVPIAVLGIGFAFAYRESRSLVSSITCHAIFNAASLSYILFLAARSST